MNHAITQAMASRSKRRPVARLAYALLCVVGTAQAQAQAQAAKKVLTIEDAARWRSIDGSRISGDGNWVVYGLRHPNAIDQQPVLRVVRLDPNRDEEIANAAQASFSDDSRFVAYYVDLPYADAKKLREGNKPVPRKAQLMDLQTGAKSTWDDVQSFAFSTGSAELLVRKRQVDPKSKHKGVDAILYDLKTGRNQLLGSVGESAFNKSGDLLAYTVDAAERDANGVYVVELNPGRVTPLDNDARIYSRLTWNEDGTALAVLKGIEVDKKRERENVLIAFPDVKAAAASQPELGPAKLDPAKMASFPKNMVVSERQTLLWSANGKLVFLGIKVQSAAPDTGEKKKGTDEVADVDVWSTSDPRIQSVQMSTLESDRNFTFRASFDVANGRFVRLTDSTMREMDVTVDGRWGVGRDPRAYISDYKRPSADLYRVNPSTGERTLMLRSQITNTTTGSHVFGTSPDGHHFLYWRDSQFHLYDLDNARTAPLTKSGVNFIDDEFDYPGPKPPYGFAAWTKDGKAIVLGHRNDLWLYPLNGGAPTNLTGGLGSKHEIRFRPINTEATDAPQGSRRRALASSVDPSKPMLLSAYGQWTKKSGYYELRDGQMRELVFDDASFNNPIKAAQADKFLFTRETFAEFPNLRVSGPSFKDAKKVSDANPQQAEYHWGHRVLFDFTNKKGVRLQGILAIPDDYKPGEKRPMLVNFYEKNSQNLHRYTAPGYIGSFNQIPTQAVSQGYLTMLPDIHFNTGATHSDMLECVEAATRKVIEMGYADPKRIGLHGHSFSGQGAAFVGTRSKMFAAVGMGAGVTDLTSDFSHNWGWSYTVPGAGQNALDYYLYYQGRFGSDPWADPELYRFESGRTHIPEAVAPFLILHGTADATVAFQEGLGFYNALRYNHKKATLLAYVGEGHSLRGLANRRDLTIRYLQFFDHYLNAKPAPRWLTEGVPYIEKDLRKDPARDQPPGAAAAAIVPPVAVPPVTIPPDGT